MGARMRQVIAAALPALVLAAAPAAATAQDPEIVLAFSSRSLLGGGAFTVSGVLPGGAADAGRPLELHERRAPFPGAWQVVQTGVSGASGEFTFSVTPVRKSYWAVVAPVTAARPREASRGMLVALRRHVSIRTSTRHPWAGRTVRFSGFVSPAFPAGPGSVATLQERTRGGAFVNVRAVLLRPAGAFSSYRVRMRMRRSGEYRVVVPATTYFSPGASVSVSLRARRR